MIHFIGYFTRLAIAVAGLTLVMSAAAQNSTSAFGQQISSLVFGELVHRDREDLNYDGFVIGQGVVQFNVQVDERLTVFSEMTATAKEGQDFNFEVERLFVRYDFSDQYKLSVGRYHTPLGYWNSSFHHGSWLQTTISRPQTIKFGSNVVPIHFVGALLEGNISDSDFGYKVGYGNGRSDKINAPGDFGDTNNNRAWMVSGFYRPLGRRRVYTGFSFYSEDINLESVAEIEEQLFSAYFSLETESPEVVVEYTYANHESAVSRGKVNSIYAQMAYRLSGKAYNFKPYIRAERLEVDDDDPLLGALGLDYEGVVAGIRWDFSSFAAIKAEVRQEEFDHADSRSSIWLQLSFVINASRGAQGYVSKSAQNRRVVTR